MPQCKMSDCREPSLPTGKRYCAAHKAEYLRRQKEEEERYRSRPDCEVDGCDSKALGHSPLCQSHYDRQQNDRQYELELELFMSQPDEDKWAEVFHFMRGRLYDQ